MVDESVYGFGATDVRRIVGAVRSVESMPPRDATPFQAAGTQNFQLLRVSVSAIVGPGGIKYYTAVRDDIFNPATGLWSASADALWLIQRQNADLTANASYNARQIGEAAPNGQTRPLFVTTEQPYLVNVTCTGGAFVLTFST